METKVCKCCGRDLPLEVFSLTKNGITRRDTCKECINSARSTSKANKIAIIEAQRQQYDEMFEGKDPVDVIKIMSRAKRWLESRGYEITLKGSYTIKKEVKFNEL